MRLVGLLVVIFCLFISVCQAQIQEVKFTQFFNFPLSMQPAATGNFQEAYRVAGIYRKQWNSIDSEFQTFGVAGDMKFNRGFYSGDSWGVGFYILDDHLGQGLMQSQELGVSAAYHHPLDFQGRHRLSLGINLSYTISSFDINKLTFESQYVGFVPDLNAPNGEPFSSDNMANYDAGAGLAYSFLINKKWQTSIYASWLNMVQPQESFFSDSLSYAHMNRKLISGKVKYTVNEKVALVPRWLVSLQQNETEVSSGIVGEYTVDQHKRFRVDLGTFTQWAEYLVLYAGGTYQGIELHVSYDFSISGLKEIAEVEEVDFSNPGVFEISFIYRGRKKSDKGSYAVPCRIF
ncbi:PorP/SprF family type IX secretion system membrane protein [Fulvivirga sediminis]|uniref:PorP/SprF family type IX secretion system membrane protein n=1 Tax=Fulvivirga sediminis TaxID=2803949 RepID=A0A937F9S1_9BACT|nr:PorP/SprF family type IX secretion system membrane protein [Fulvivirga sediminis]MBL3657607.1 PorP/SprF family type IX secretion system membrane protein [Fulvivirga sediminis]